LRSRHERDDSGNSRTVVEVEIAGRAGYVYFGGLMAYVPFAARTKVARRLPRIVFLASPSYDSVHLVAHYKALTIN
jgi:hypothetical protein